MSNSAWSGNTAGLASAVSPGLVGTSTQTFAGNKTFTGDIVPATPFCLRNKLINGGTAVDQRNAGATQTFTAAAALAYSVDRWYGYCTGANVTGARVAGTGSQFAYRFTGAASVTAIGFAQRIEQLNSYSLAGQTATLSVDLANSLLTTVTWTAYYANTADTFGSLASPTKTSIATGTFTVTSTVTRYQAQITVPAAATTGIEILFTVGAQTSGTWTIQNAQLEAGSAATPFEQRPIGMELGLCQRYCVLISAATQTPICRAVIIITNNIYFSVCVPSQVRKIPTFSKGTLEVVSMSNTTQTGFTFSVSEGSVDSGCFIVVAIKTSHGLTDGFLRSTSAVFDSEL